MATLQKIRNRAGLLIIAIGVALLAFIVGDGLRSGSTLLQQKKQVALRIDGKKIGIQDYQEHLSRLYDNAEASGQKLNEEQRIQLNNQLAQEYVQNAAVEKISKETGLHVSAKEYVALINGQGAEQSPIIRQFFSQMGIDPNSSEQINNFLLSLNPDKLKKLPAEQQQYAQRLSVEWESISARVKHERIIQKYNAILNRTFVFNDLDKQAVANGVTRQVAMVRTPSTFLRDTTVQATDAEIKAFYDKHPSYFRLAVPYTKADYIVQEIRPSASDYKKAEATLAEVLNELKTTHTPEVTVRKYDHGFAPEFYLTESELTSLRLPEKVTEFLKTEAVGAINTPVIQNDRYDIVKLLDRKTATPSVTARIIVLDTLHTARIDSIVTAINHGADFASLVEMYSIDPQTKNDGGLITFPDPQTGALQSKITRRIAYTSGLDTLFKVPAKQAFVFGNPPAQMILMVDELTPPETIYKFAYTSLPVTFSEETFNNYYAKMNNLLAEAGSSFNNIESKAQKEGLEVIRDAQVSANSVSLDNIPSSREVVSWILRGEKGDVNKKVFRCGDNHLVIACIGDRISGNKVPLEDVKKQISHRLTAEKRGDKLVANLKAKNYTTLTQYAQELGTAIDTIPGITIHPSGMYPATLFGEAFATPLNKVSAPFRADSEVMIIEPLSEEKAPTAASPSTIEQQRSNIGLSMGYRCFSNILAKMKVDDNRGMFY